MPTEETFFSKPSEIIFCAKDGGEWNELPTLSAPTATVAPNPDADITPSWGRFSFTATCSGEFSKDLLFPRTKLPRKMKKAAKTLYFARDKRLFTIRLNPSPKTKWQRRVAQKCACNQIMTPRGEILTLYLM